MFLAALDSIPGYVLTTTYVLFIGYLLFFNAYTASVYNTVPLLNLISTLYFSICIQHAPPSLYLCVTVDAGGVGVSWFSSK